MKKNKRKYEEVNYWETMADSLIALLLSILLIALLLVLYLVRMPEEHIDDETESFTEQYAQSESAKDDGKDDDETNPVGPGGWGENGQGGSSGNGGSEGQGGGHGDKEHDYEHPGIADGEGYGKAAVYVEIIDGETNRTIKHEGVEFELYNDKNQLQVLSTYYPEKIDFKKFVTDEVGTFYLPEKIIVQDYYLHALTRVPGYDYAEDTKLEIDDGYEWNDPYTAKVIMYPEKNIIKLRLKDYNTGKTLTGATFDVVAAEDITTKDGTIRCKEGDVVNTIILDKDGYGESEELYLGKYLVQQVEVPQYYAKLMTDTEVAVESKAKATEVKVVELREEKTKASISLFDELYVATSLQDAKFTLKSSDGKYVQSDVTNDKGRLVFTDLHKDTTYQLHQESTTEGYIIPGSNLEFTVDVDGLISGVADHKLDISNRMIRISVGIQDMLFRGQVSDVNVGVKNSEDVIIKTWSSNAIEQSIEAITPGEYMVIIAGNEGNAKRIKVEDTAEIQTFQFGKWTTTDIGVIIALILFLILLIVALVLFLANRARKKQEEKEEKEALESLPTYEDTKKTEDEKIEV